jgi:hypothetical protein
MRPNFAPFMAEVSRPEAHGLVIAIAAKMEAAPVAWNAEDAHAVLVALASCIKKRGRLYEDVLTILDDCADSLDNLIAVDESVPDRFYQQDAEAA